MYFFDKKTEYLVWKMQEGQGRSVGTVRFWVMDQVCRVEVAVTGCGNVQGTYPVYVLSGHLQSLLGEIMLHKGKGSFCEKLNALALGHSKIPYTQVTGIHIDLKSEGCLEQKWLPLGRGAAEPNNKLELGYISKQEHVLEQPEKEAEKNNFSETEVSRVKKEKYLNSEQSGPAGERGEQRGSEKERTSTTRQGEELQSKGISSQEKKAAVKPPEKRELELYPDKWQQLCAIYPVVHPFGDGRAYLSIEPRDFVVLQERFQPMVQNSFLLHGFYHYRHLLLGRSRQGNYVQYYLGVPGVFYEKEKSAALFYGFESFEGAAMPAAEGSFGYYMKRVQI